MEDNRGSGSINIDNLPCSVCVLEPQKILNRAILRYDEENECLVYCMEALAEAFMDMGMSYLEAKEHICFNVLSMYVDGWPQIV